MTAAQDTRRSALGRNLTYGLLDEVGKTIVTGRYEGKAFPTEAELARREGRDHQPAFVLLERIRRDRAQSGTAGASASRLRGR